MNWSGGKDSAMALHKIGQEGHREVTSLLTTVNEQYNRVSMHGLRAELLVQQANALDIPLTQVMLPEQASMEVYGQRMSEAMSTLKAQGVEYSVFGDIFLEDLRAYRESKLQEANLKGEFPIWGRNTTALINHFIDTGFKAILICTNNKRLPAEFIGREIDQDFLKDLPKGVDPCGENGEYHTFVYDGPIFKKSVPFQKGEVVTKTYKSGDGADFDTEFLFLDLLPE